MSPVSSITKYTVHVWSHMCVEPKHKNINEKKKNWGCLIVYKNVSQCSLCSLFRKFPITNIGKKKKAEEPFSYEDVQYFSYEIV